MQNLKIYTSAFFTLILLVLTVPVFAQGLIDSDGGVVTITFDNTTPGILNGAFDASDITSDPAPGDLDSDGVDFDDDLPGAADIPAVFGNNDVSLMGPSNGNVIENGRVGAFNVLDDEGVNWTLGIAPGTERWSAKDDDDGQIVFKFINNSGVTFTAFRVKFDLYEANTGNKNSIVETYLTTDVSTPNYGPLRDSWATTGHSPSVRFRWSDANRRDFSVTSGVNVPHGGAIYFRFYIYDGPATGTDKLWRDKIAIDNISIIGASTPDLLDQCIAPIASCKDATVNLNSSGNHSLSTSKVNNGSVIDCELASFTVSPNSFNCSNVGQNTVTLSITDIEGNSSSCTATVTVKDKENPTASCQNLTVQLDSNGNGSTSANAVDNGSSDACGLDDLSLDNSTFDCGDLGNNTVVLTVTDNNNRQSTCAATVRVEDVTAPVPDVTNLPEVTGECSATVTAPTATDNCAGTVTATTSDPTSYSEQGTYTLTWTYDDGNNNTATQMQTIIINDVTAPTIDCSGLNPDRSIDPGECSFTMLGTGFDPLFSDNCSGAGISNDYNNGSTLAGETFPVGSTVVIWTATDAAGGTATCSITVAVTDDEAPMLDCSGINPGRSADPGQCSFTMPGTGFDPAFSDNCPGVSIENDYNNASSLAGEAFPVGSTTVIWTATDAAGGTATCSITVAVTDDEAPMIDCSGINPDRSADPGQCSFTMPSTGFDPAFSDNCPGASIENDYNNASSLAGETFPVGSTVVTWTATAAGGTATCSITVAVTDDEAPMLDCSGINPDRSADSGQCSFTMPGTGFDPVFSDNCPGASIENDYNNASSLAGETFPVGPTVVTWTATDAAGTTAICSITVAVSDDKAPMVDCSGINPDRSAAPGLCSFTMPGTGFDPAFSDNCPGASIENDYNNASSLAGETFPVGSTTVIWTVTAANGTTSDCSIDIVIEDEEMPVPVCLDATVSFNGQNMASVPIAALYDAAASSDNCGTINLVSPLPDPVVDCDDLGQVIDVPVVVNDGNGNEGMCMATITVSGLPCGWIDNGGIACSGSSSDFDAGSSTFNLTAGSCAPAFPYTEDATSFVFTELCGDGEIIAKVDNINGGEGFAGVMVRDSEVPGAPKVSIGTNTIDRLRKEVRAIAGYPSYPQAVLAYDQFWVRITRTGPSFRAFASPDGVQWIPYIFQNIQMGSCIKVGLYAYNENATSPIIATFSNVSINGVPVGALDVVSITTFAQSFDGAENGQELTPDITLYPNPAQDIVNLDLLHLIGETATISIFNTKGQLMKQMQYDVIEEVTTEINVNALPAGTYFVNVKTANRNKSLRFVKQ